MTAHNFVISKLSNERTPVRLHLTNITGLGAVRLLQSLLPSLVAQSDYLIEKVYLPASGDLSNVTLFEDRTVLTYYKRYLPNAISRLLECTLLGSQFDGETPLLVFGDIPIRCKCRQTVFVQTTLLVRGTGTGRRLGAVKYWIARWIFRRNLNYASSFIVQTQAMKLSLIESYPEIENRTHIIAQPAPDWLIRARIKRTNFLSDEKSGLRLFYPAAPYPHKNHHILAELNHSTTWPVSELILTIPENLNPDPSASWIRCVDKLEPEAVINIYRTTDALLFLSLTESFGFPLIEAMWIGLPIVCPDLPYARTLCGERAIYFDPYHQASLSEAISELARRRDAGWWPDWSANLQSIPRDWQEVANAMLRLATSL